MMTLEALASLSVAVMMSAAALLFVSQGQGAGTSLYEQQLGQDVAEVIWLSGLAGKYGGYVGGVGVEGETAGEVRGGLEEIGKGIGWCVGLELKEARVGGDKRAVATCGGGEKGGKIVVSRTLVSENGFEEVLVSIEKDGFN